MIFINTRPANRAQPLSLALQDKGMTVLPLPLLELAAVDISEREQQYQFDFTKQPDKYQALVVVSPTAAHMGLAACPKGFVPNCAVIAVGHATAKVLEDAGWQVQCPEEYSNEGMIKMPSLNRLGTGNHVLVWRGRGGRRVLVNFLHDNKVTVDAIAWYQRRCPANAFDTFKVLQQQLITMDSDEPLSPSALVRPITLVSSGEAFTNWRMLFAEAESSKLPNTRTYSKWAQLVDFNYLTFGKRLTETVTSLGLNCVRIEHLDADEVWHGIEKLNDSVQKFNGSH